MAMKELLRTNDVVKLSWLRALLSDSGIATLVLDDNTSVLQGSTVLILRRLMVGDDDYQMAKSVLIAAGEEREL